MLIQPTSLQQRIFYFILIPVFLLLVSMGGFGFVYARNILLNQWSETAIANLQKAAHHIDMRLIRPKELLLMLQENSASNQEYILQNFMTERLRSMNGVVQVNVDMQAPESTPMALGQIGGKGGRMSHRMMSQVQVTSPEYNAALSSETISIVSELKNDEGRKVGQIEVVVSFHDLIDQIVQTSWWKSNKAYLVDHEGNILTRTVIKNDDHAQTTKKKFGSAGNLLEQMTLEAIKKNLNGTILGPGHPPEEVSGYFHLEEAPWSLVIIAPGREVLKTMIKFGLYYFITIAFFSLMILLFMKVVIGNIAHAIKKLSEATQKLSIGQFGNPLPVTSKDEIGELTNNFNTMIKQLENGVRLKEAMDIAMEVQQNLLPQSSLCFEGLEVSGLIIYCDETGGDYYDFIEFPKSSGEKVGIAVGDVVGHGIGAALLMTTTRALLRSKCMQAGSLGQIITDVNRLLCMDTAISGNFVTLFLLMVDKKSNEIQWVRAGHDPAMVYDSKRKEFSELKGDGLVLGIDETLKYEQNALLLNQDETVIFLGTDGAWEAENDLGEEFGKERIREIIAQNYHLAPAGIIKSIAAEITAFRGDTKQSDDITLVVIKKGPGHLKGISSK